jgi:hypothetical protein
MPSQTAAASGSNVIMEEESKVCELLWVDAGRYKME